MARRLPSRPPEVKTSLKPGESRLPPSEREAVEGIRGAMLRNIQAAVARLAPQLRADVEREIDVREPDLELLLLAFLNDLVYRRDAEGLLLRPARIEVDAGPPARVRGTCAGERLEPGGRALALDVKAATAYRLGVARSGDRWEARATLDV